MNLLHIFVHVRPAVAITRRAQSIDEIQIEALELDASQLSLPFSVGFEQSVDQLRKLPRMFVELDGSFVWAPTPSDSKRPLNGMLYDRDGRLLTVELNGACPAMCFGELLRCFGWPETEFVFQEVRTGLFLDESAIRKLMANVDPMRRVSR